MTKKYIFICDETEGDEHTRSVTVDIDGTDLPLDDMLVYFCDFLRGCGYVLPPGDVTFEEIE